MAAIPVDLCIKARWIVPMTEPGAILEQHCLVVRNGRILDLLPSADAALRYTPELCVERPAHLVLPGFVNARAMIGAGADGAQAPRFRPEQALLCMANMLKGGVTCFCDAGCFPRATAETALAQGMRMLIGLPVSERASPWARSAAECLTHALELYDEFKAHPFIYTGFAPHGIDELGDETLARIAMLAAEIDAAVLVSLNERQSEIGACIARRGMRPLERLHGAGLLTPSLCAAHMAVITGADIALARRGGIGVVLCLESDLARGAGLAPIAEFAAAGLRLGLGTDGTVRGNDQDLWTETKLAALHSGAAEPAADPWPALAAATRGGAGTLGLEAEIGTLESGKWADLCCIDLGGPATQPLRDPVRQLVFSGGRDIVSDVWVAGRRLLCDGEFTRLDSPALARRRMERS